VRTWLLAIARRTCADAVRRKIRVRRLLQRVTPRDELEPEPTGGPELELVMARLDPDRKAAFVMTQVLGLSYAEAAEACGCPVGTIRSRVARAREDLVTWLTEEAGRADAAG
jgi:RNA polymerase sigma-70 factor (ECF subfamily)